MDQSLFNWTYSPIIGTALIMGGAVIDSLEEDILPWVYYRVGKRKTGEVGAVIIPSYSNIKDYSMYNTSLKV